MSQMKQGQKEGEQQVPVNMTLPPAPAVPQFAQTLGGNTAGTVRIQVVEAVEPEKNDVVSE